MVPLPGGPRLSTRTNGSPSGRAPALYQDKWFLLPGGPRLSGRKGGPPPQRTPALYQDRRIAFAEDPGSLSQQANLRHPGTKAVDPERWPPLAKGPPFSCSTGVRFTLGGEPLIRKRSPPRARRSARRAQKIDLPGATSPCIAGSQATSLARAIRFTCRITRGVERTRSTVVLERCGSPRDGSGFPAWQARSSVEDARRSSDTGCSLRENEAPSRPQ